MSTWSTSNYRQRKAQRQAARPAKWLTNPETQEKFFIRPVGAAALGLAGYLPSILKKEAVEGWKQHGVEAEPSSGSDDTVRRTIEDIDRTNRTNARLVYEACLIPTLTAIGEDLSSVQERALHNCELAFADDESWNSASAEEKLQRASEVVLPLEELEESDLKFILDNSYAHGVMVPMKGGQVMNITDLKSLHKKPGRRARTGTGG